MNERNFSRRQFLGIAGSVAGAALLTSMGLPSGLSKNEREVNLDEIKHKESETDILVIGGGIAGLFAAVKGHDGGAKVLIVSKGGLGSSGQTPFAKGIFAYDPKTASMTIDQFVSKVSLSAMGTNNPVYTRQMAENSLDRVNDLKEWGFFDSSLYNGTFSTPILERKIPLIERVMITHLIKEEGRIAGAAGFSMDDSTLHIFKSKSVVLCTGAGGFKPNGFPICDLTHDGTVMAYNIGAKVTGKEWNDGHVGQAENAAACYDGWHGMFEKKCSVTGISVRHDLGVDMNYQAYKSGNPVSMSPPGAGSGAGTGDSASGGPVRPEGLDDSNPQGDRDSGNRPPSRGGEPPKNGGRSSGEGGRSSGEGGRSSGEGGRSSGEGAPPGMGGTSVGGASAGMAIHKSEGLVPINERGESNIPGLFAAGDALGSYMAGAIYTQIGSSLSGSAVQGAIASEAAVEYCKGVTEVAISRSKIDSITEEILAPLQRESGYSPAWVTQMLQSIMIPNFVLYIKKESLLKAALVYVEELRDHHAPMLRAADFHELRLAHETSNMICSAEMKLKASIMRKESRCSHYRLDYPYADDENWRAWINIYRDTQGEMKLEKQPFDSWPN